MKNEIIVIKDNDYPAAKIIFEGKEYPAVVGKNGAIDLNQKKEGDWKTPVGSFKILGIYYRPDRIEKPDSSLPIFEITVDSIWVNEPTSKLYNQRAGKQDITGGVSHESLFREDHLYDIFLDLDYNRNPAKQGKGSAIFLHVARNEAEPSKTPTTGCIAISKRNLMGIITKLNREAVVTVTM